RRAAPADVPDERRRLAHPRDADQVVRPRLRRRQLHGDRHERRVQHQHADAGGRPAPAQRRRKLPRVSERPEHERRAAPLVRARLHHEKGVADVSEAAPKIKAELAGVGGESPAWAIAPTAPLSWPDLGTIGIELDAFHPTVPAGTCFLSVELYNLASSYVEPYTVVVSVENAPSPADRNLHERALVDLLTKDVAITKRTDEPAQTELTLRLVN